MDELAGNPNFPSKSHKKGGILSFVGRDCDAKMDGFYINECVVAGPDCDGCDGYSETDAGFLCAFNIKSQKLCKIPPEE